MAKKIIIANCPDFVQILIWTQNRGSSIPQLREAQVVSGENELT